MRASIHKLWDIPDGTEGDKNGNSRRRIDKATRSRTSDSWITRRSRKFQASSATCWPICFALYLKTKNFHWHMTGKNFRDYHLLAR